MFLHAASDLFLRPALCVLSEYGTILLKKLWQMYVCNQEGFAFERVADDEKVDPMRMNGARFVAYKVNADKWTCTCFFYKSSMLPCRHFLYVARDVLHRGRYPNFAVAQRWRMGHAALMIEPLKDAIMELASLRTSNRDGSCAAKMEATEDGILKWFDCDRDDKIEKGETRYSKVDHVKLHRGEKSKSAVLDDWEKSNIIDAAMDDAR